MTSVVIVALPTVGGQFEIEWPNGWRLPCIGERLYIPGKGVYYIDSLTWDMSRTPYVDIGVSVAKGYE